MSKEDDAHNKENVLEMFGNPDRAEAIARAVAERDRFLAELPPERQAEAAALQATIDSTLAGAGHKANRMVLIYTLMMESFHRMRQALQDLSATTQEAKATTASPPTLVRVSDPLESSANGSSPQESSPRSQPPSQGPSPPRKKTRLTIVS